jgi:nucleoid DNA-binding protein
MSESSTLKKSELIDQIAQRLEAGQVTMSKKMIDTIVGEIFAAVKAEVIETGKCNVNSFGTFTVRTRNARTGRDPKSGVEIPIPASNTVGLKVSKKLKDDLKNKLS